MLAAGLALGLAVLATLAAFVWRDRAELLRTQHARLELLVRVLEDHATRSIEAVSLATATMAELVERGALPEDPTIAAAMRQTLVNLPYLRGLAWVDAAGRVVASSDAADTGLRLPLEILGPLPPAGRDAIGSFVAGRRLQDVAVGVERMPAPAGLGFLPLTRSLAHPVRGPLVLVALINPDAFANFQEVTLNDPQAAAALTTFVGVALAATRSAGVSAGQDLSSRPPFRDFLPRIEHRGWTGVGLRPDAQIAAFRVLRSRPLVVMAEIGTAPVLQAWWRQMAGLLGAGALAVFVIAASTALAARSLGREERARAERDEAQSAVALREHELSVIFRSVQELLFRVDKQGQLSFLNLRRDPLTGRPTDDLIGLPLHGLVSADTSAGVQGLFAAGPEVGARRTQARLEDAVGPGRWFDVAVVPLLENGLITGFAGSAVDITEVRAAQAALQSQLAFTESLIEGNPLPISVLDIQGRYLRVNRAWEAFTGRPRAEVIGAIASASLPPQEAALHDARDRELVAAGTELRYEAQRQLPDGSVRDLLLSKSLVRDGQGRPIGIVVTFMDISDVREAERATRDARDAALQASLTKSEFMANVSHELRTPLQSILGFSELGQRRARGQEALAGMFDDIHRAGKRMLALVNDLLDLARTESHEMSMSFEFLDIRGLVREVCRELRPLLDARTLTLALDLPREPLVAGADALRFQQVVRNVLANAIRFSPPSGQIDIALAQDQIGGVLLTVGDRGPGIPEDELERIFDAFIQSSRTKDGSGGTGLGLAISRRIMQAHGGAITATMRGGGGSVFRVWLPGRDTPAPLVFD